MKKSFVLSALVCGIVMLLGSCADSSLRTAVDALNNSCPKQVNPIATMESVTYEDKVITVNYSVDDSSVTIDSLTTALDLVKNQVLVRLQNSDDLKDFISTCVEAGATIKHVYTGKESGKSFTIDLSAEDMKAILEGKVEPLQTSESEDARELEEAAESAVEKGEDVIKEEVRAIETESQTE